MFSTSALCITAYIVIGAYFEERKLERQFGDVYRQYKRQVPAFIPLPWKRLTAGAASRLSNPG